MSNGIKYDKEKPRYAEFLLDFQEPLEKLYEVWEFGANKYGKSNWKELDNGLERYSNALIRHLFAENKNIYDEETNMFHASHIAFNALARLYFINRSENNG